ncbi:MAG: hypothetical protein GWM92_16535 [Gemmatimonadetes bacterium]|nr:hypothetical protein [Gemmatimonadota bacterium]NIR80364.1 hypothetical protein [Gemmatimonadota bacterium]NIT89127.1 hypothetical protein [Gemmatimonadota bacterium]NIU32924.1 hypothetical protein [Gemmatimonadota bacterium]NIU37323.1 hypothetical protein [Gemmatimonadota bacterium]
MERTTKARLASLGVLLAVLVAGFAMGLAWERRSGSLRVEDPAGGEAGAERSREGDDRDGSGKRRRRLIIDRVGLAPEQEERVDSIVRIHRQGMKELQREFRAEYNPRYRALIQETRDEIRGLLTPAQRSTYDSLLAERDRRREREREERKSRRR